MQHNSSNNNILVRGKLRWNQKIYWGNLQDVFSYLQRSGVTFVLHVRKCSTTLLGLYRASTCTVLHRKRTVPTQNLISVTRTANQKRNCLLISDLHNDKQAIILYKNKANIFFNPIQTRTNPCDLKMCSTTMVIWFSPCKTSRQWTPVANASIFFPPA